MNNDSLSEAYDVEVPLIKNSGKKIETYLNREVKSAKITPVTPSEVDARSTIGSSPSEHRNYAEVYYRLVLRIDSSEVGGDVTGFLKRRLLENDKMSTGVPDMMIQFNDTVNQSEEKFVYYISATL